MRPGAGLKKIRGKLHDFGPWKHPDAALQKYLDQRDDLQAGGNPCAFTEGLTIRDLANRFLTSKQHLVRTGEIAQRTFNDYYVTCERLIGEFGRTRLVSDLAGDDFERLRASLSISRGPVALGNEVLRARTVFKFAFALRHTFQTIAGDSKDQVAVDHIMGHARDDMASVYRERISDERLRAVTECLRNWHFNADSITGHAHSLVTAGDARANCDSMQL
jgi:hypothetical protein